MRSRLAVLMVADVVGYSTMMDRDEAMAIEAIKSLKMTHLEPPVEANGGEVLKRMGDGWIFAFNSVTTMVNCATEIQNQLAGNPQIKLRIGGHIGEIVEDESDFYGAGVNLAQRLETEAPPGGLMVSEDLYRQLTGDLASVFIDAGTFKLKNIALPVNGYQWRPDTKQGGGSGQVPSFCVESFDFAPDDSDTKAAATDLRDQLMIRLSRRTGIRLLDDSSGRSTDSTYLLRGRLRISGNRGRLNIALILRSEQQPVLSQVYEGDTTDIFSFCDQIIDRVDVDLRLQINAFDGDRIKHIPDDELSIAELRSKSATTSYTTTMPNCRYSVELLEKALDLNPDDPMSLAMRGEFLSTLINATYREPTAVELESLEKGVNLAVETLPRSDYVFCARAYFYIVIKRDPDFAKRDIDRALSLNPAYATGLEMKGLANLLSENYSEAIVSLKKAVSISATDPWLPIRLFYLAVSQICNEEYEFAIESLEQAIHLKPNQRTYAALKAYCCRSTNHDAEAARLEKTLANDPIVPSPLSPKPPLPESQNKLALYITPGIR